MEASALEALDQMETGSLAQSTAGSRSDAEGFSHAIEVLRHDGLSTSRSRQLITRYHRDRSNADPRRPSAPSSTSMSSSSSSATAWGSLEDGVGSPWVPPPSYQYNRTGTNRDAVSPEENEGLGWRMLGRRTSPSRSPTREESLHERFLSSRPRMRVSRGARPSELRAFLPAPDYFGGFRLFRNRDAGRPLGDYMVRFFIFLNSKSLTNWLNSGTRILMNPMRVCFRLHLLSERSNQKRLLIMLLPAWRRACIRIGRRRTATNGVPFVWMTYVSFRYS